MKRVAGKAVSLVMALLFAAAVFFAGSRAAYGQTGIEYYNHNLAYSVTVPEAYKDKTLQLTDESLNVRFDKDILFVFKATNYFNLFPEDAVEMAESELSLEDPFFAETFSNHTYRVKYFNNLIKSYSGGKKVVQAIEAQYINDVKYWVCSFDFLGSKDKKTGEGRIYFTVYSGNMYMISVISRSAMIEDVPEVYETIASVRLGRRISTAMKYVWSVVAAVNFIILTAIIWIITRPRKYSVRQLRRMELKALESAKHTQIDLPGIGLLTAGEAAEPVQGAFEDDYDGHNSDYALGEVSNMPQNDDLLAEKDDSPAPNDDISVQTDKREEVETKAASKDYRKIVIDLYGKAHKSLNKVFDRVFRRKR